jgi:hypothetical protein
MTGTQTARLHGRKAFEMRLGEIQVEFMQSSLDFLQKSFGQECPSSKIIYEITKNPFVNICCKRLRFRSNQTDV